MADQPIDPLATTDWLAKQMNEPNLRVVDMRGYVTIKQLEPGVDEATYRGAPAEYQASHIPGSVYIDWTKDIIDPDDSVPVQLASPERFALIMGQYGIGDDTHVVAVDHMGGQFATRLWWALRTYGHTKVSVLDGGWNRWVEEEHEVTSEPTVVEPAVFTSRLQSEWRITAEALAERLGVRDLQLLDARDAGQYNSDRRRGPRGGHIPGATSLPRELFFAETGGFRPLEQIRQLIAERGLTPEKPTVTYCNGGVAATVLLFHLDRLGFQSLTNYDGSWNEWSGRLDLPIN